MYDPNQQYYGGQPQPGYPQPGGYPQGGYPPGGYPQGGYPQGGYPQPGYGGGFPPQQPGFAPQPDFAPQGAGTEPEHKGFEFNDASIRRGFIRKVYSILMVQLSISVAFIALCVYHEGTKHFLRSHRELFWIALIIVFVTMMAMACCEGVRRQAPTNFIFLGLFTLAESFLLGVIAVQASPESVLMAVGATAVVCAALTLFAFQTKIDFTVCNGILFVALIIFVVFGLIAMFFPGRTIHIIYSAVGALLFSVYLVYDTQLMMGGDHKYSISPEEYIFAALNLYLDIIQIFMHILALISASRD